MDGFFLRGGDTIQSPLSVTCAQICQNLLDADSRWRLGNDPTLKKPRFCIPRSELLSTPTGHLVTLMVSCIKTSRRTATAWRSCNLPILVFKCTDTLRGQLFRKEAIFRRMRHYSRENERSQSRVAELERRRNTCEASMAAMEACWTQVHL